MKRKYLFMIIAVICLCQTFSCAGARRNIKFDELKYPASTSPCLYGANNEVLTKDRELEVVGSFLYEKSLCNIFYSLIPVSGGVDAAENMNSEIEKRKADGMVNVTIEVKDGYLNDIPAMAIIPFWPGFANVTIKGQIVRVKESARISSK